MFEIISRLKAALVQGITLPTNLAKVHCSGGKLSTQLAFMLNKVTSMNKNMIIPSKVYRAVNKI